MAYDFGSLSAADFEDLARDLVGAALGLRFEAFAEGPDGGMDGRHACAGETTILQAKHYRRSGKDALQATMIKERATIDRLGVQRYILATSAPLTPMNKVALAAVIGPSLQTTGDILGPDDLNALLRRFPDIEIAHQKLWAGTSAVLQKVVADAVREQGRRSATPLAWRASRAAEASERRFRELTGTFSGRHVYLVQMDEDCGAGESRLSAITAPPGVGKSALMAAWCSRRQSLGGALVSHFISGKYPATTEPLAILSHLAVQIAALDGLEADLSLASVPVADWFHQCLRRDRPPDDPMTVVLDGMDEAIGLMPEFLPYELGRGWHVVISCRDDGEGVPSALRDLLGARSFHQIRLAPLDRSELGEWLASASADTSADDLATLAADIHLASGGIALFAKFLIDDAALASGKPGAGLAGPERFQDYIRNEIDGLDHRVGWSLEERFLFALLTLTKTPIRASNIERCLLHARADGIEVSRLHLHALRHPIARWLTMTREKDGVRGEPSFVFAHPLLAAVFRDGLGYRLASAKAALLALVREWKRRPSDYAQQTALDHLVDFAAERTSTVSVAEAVEPAFDYGFVRDRVCNAGINAILEPLAVADTLPDCPRTVSPWRQLIGRRSNSLVFAQGLHADGLWPSLFQQGVEHGVLEAADFPRSSVALDAMASASKTMEGHTGTISDAVELPGDLGFVSSSYDATLRLWRRDGTQGAVLAGHSGRVSGVSLLPDSKGLVSWSEDGTLRLWGLSGKPLAVLDAQSGAVSYVAVLYKAKCILSCGASGAYRTWSFAGAPLAVITGHPGGVKGSLVRPDEDGFLSWGGDKALKLWSLSGDLLREFGGHIGGVEGARWIEPGSSFVSWDGEQTVRIWSTAGDLIREILLGPKKIHSVVPADRAGRLMVIFDDLPEITLIPGDTSKDRQRLQGHQSEIFGVRVRPGGRGFVSWGLDHSARLWDSNGQPGKTLSHEDTVYQVSNYGSDGRLISCDSNGTIFVWDADGDLVRKFVGHSHWATYFAPMRDGHRILSWGANRVLRVDDLDEPPVDERGRRAERDFSQVVATPVSHQLLTWGRPNTIQRFDVDGRERPLLVGHTEPVRQVVVLGSRLAVSLSYDETVRLWDLDSGKGVCLGHDGHPVTGMKAVPGQSGFVSWCRNGDCYRWDQAGSIIEMIASGIQYIKNVSATAAIDGFLISGMSEAKYYGFVEGEASRLLWSVREADGALSMDDPEKILLVGSLFDSAIVNKQGSVLSILEGHTRILSGALIIPRSGEIVSWDCHGNLCFWTPEGDLVRHIAGPDGAVDRGPFYDPDGPDGWPRRALVLSDASGVLTWADHRSIFHWSPRSELLHEMRGHFASIQGVRELAGGQGFLSWGIDGHIVHWSADFQVQGLCSPFSGGIMDVIPHPTELGTFIVLEENRLNRLRFVH